MLAEGFSAFQVPREVAHNQGLVTVPIATGRRPRGTHIACVPLWGCHEQGLEDPQRERE